MDERMAIGDPAAQVEAAEALRRDAEPPEAEGVVGVVGIRTDYRLGQTVYFLWETRVGDTKVVLPLRGKVVEIRVTIAEKRNTRGDEYLVDCPALKGRDMVPDGWLYATAAQAIENATVKNVKILEAPKGEELLEEDLRALAGCFPPTGKEES